MPMSQEQSIVTVTPAPDMVSDGKDEEIVDLEAIAREAKVKLDKDLVEAKVWNDQLHGRNRRGQIDWQW